MAKAAIKKPLRQQPEFKKLRDLLKQPGSRDLLWCHQAGQCVDRLFPKEQGRQYGENRMAEIAEALGDEKLYNSLTHYRNFYNLYEQSEVKRISDPKNTRNFRITWTHMKVLLSIDDEAEREKLFKTCCREKLSTDQLRRLKIQTCGRKSKGGKPPAFPKTLDAGLRQMNEDCEIWIRKHSKVWFDKSVGVISEKSEREDDPQQTQTLLDEAIENWETMQSLIGQSLPKLKQLRTHIKKDLTKVAKKKPVKRRATKKNL